MRAVRWLPATCALLAAAACGQKGPLYLPDKAAVVVTPATAPTPAAAPAPGAAPAKPNDKDENSPPK